MVVAFYGIFCVVGRAPIRSHVRNHLLKAVKPGSKS